MNVKKIFVLCCLAICCLICINNSVFATENEGDKLFSDEDVKKIIVDNMIINKVIDENDIKKIRFSSLDEVKKYTVAESDIDFNMSNKCIILDSNDDEGLETQIFLPMMYDADNNLVNAIDYLNAVPSSRTFSYDASEYDFCVMNIKVIYDYYYPQNNGYQDSYYQHGRLLVKFIYNSNIYAPIAGLEVRYISQGFITNANGYTTGVWGQTVTSVSRSNVMTNTTYGSSVSNNGNLFFARDISDEILGRIALSCVVYRFYENGVEKSGGVPIIFDQNYSNSSMIFYMQSEMSWD